MSRRTRPDPFPSAETELALMEREHEEECAILFGLSLMGPMEPEMAWPVPTVLRKRPKPVRLPCRGWPYVDMD